MEHITITEFAEAAGVTPQAVYKRIKKDLAPYVIEKPTGKLISTDALELFRVTEPVTQSRREKELEKEIERLTQEKTELHERFMEQNEKLLEILAQQTKQLENYQILLAQNQQLQQQLLNPPQPVEPVEPVDNNPQPVKKPSLLKRIFGKNNPK